MNTTTSQFQPRPFDAFVRGVMTAHALAAVGLSLFILIATPDAGHVGSLFIVILFCWFLPASFRSMLIDGLHRIHYAFPSVSQMADTVSFTEGEKNTSAGNEASEGGFDEPIVTPVHKPRWPFNVGIPDDHRPSGIAGPHEHCGFGITIAGDLWALLLIAIPVKTEIFWLFPYTLSAAALILILTAPAYYLFNLRQRIVRLTAAAKLQV